MSQLNKYTTVFLYLKVKEFLFLVFISTTCFYAINVYRHEIKIPASVRLTINIDAQKSLFLVLAKNEWI